MNRSCKESVDVTNQRRPEKYIRKTSFLQEQYS